MRKIGEIGEIGISELPVNDRIGLHDRHQPHDLHQPHDRHHPHDRKHPHEEGVRKRGIALVAHDRCKPEMLAWARTHRDTLAAHRLYATGTTGGILADELDLSITRFRSGPLGGDQQIGSRIAEGDVDVLVFFWDPLSPQPHEPDVRALLRLAVLANIPLANNRATADFVITSPLLTAADGPDRPGSAAFSPFATPPQRSAA
ncbi:methylglyoxal synthase [Streptomyces sp. SID3343]|uniref:methylglyoxal synthase n=1 Tax=Streptomyces sp. SID3343 TaxID=2690260 RepID=UPI00136AFDC0|nr:methylglyoxal synthase [Streptomyces sp. SID3343]MYW04659.1 methylglyoxal synthase [Streptomyces sp. SID3343]